MAYKNYTMEIFLLSDTLIGSSEGYGAIIDKDSVFDEVGLPIIPGKRVKGILREQADLLKKVNQLNDSVDLLFGKAGLTDKSAEYLSVSNFSLPDYESNRTHLKYLIQEGKISRSEVIEYFTASRIMTSIDDLGIASDGSLRSFRVIKKGFVFTGELSFDSNMVVDFKNIISLTRRIGSMRNRGMGHIECKLKLPVTSNVEPNKIHSI